MNDPFTAITCIEWLGAALIEMAGREIPSRWRYDDEGKLRVITDATDFEGIANSALNQVRQYGCRSMAVTVRLLDVLSRIGPHLVRANNRAVLLAHARAVRDDSLAACDFDARDDGRSGLGARPVQRKGRAGAVLRDRAEGAGEIFRQGLGLDVSVFEPDVGPLAVQGPYAEDVVASRFSVAWLSVVEGNARARRFYERNGWRDVGAHDYRAEIRGGTIPVPCRRYEKPLLKTPRDAPPS